MGQPINENGGDDKQQAMTNDQKNNAASSQQQGKTIPQGHEDMNALGF